MAVAQIGSVDRQLFELPWSVPTEEQHAGFARLAARENARVNYMMAHQSPEISSDSYLVTIPGRRDEVWEITPSGRVYTRTFAV